MVETSCNSFSVNSSSGPTRTEPYIKTIYGWTTLTFNNGQQVKFTEALSTGMILLEIEPGIYTTYTADQFAVFLLEVKSR